MQRLAASCLLLASVLIWRQRPRVLAGLVAVLLPVGARAQVDGLLREADITYEKLDFASALANYERAIDVGGLNRRDLVRAYAGVALCEAVLARAELAVAAFKRVLALDPGWKLPENVGPKVRDPYDEAKGYWALRRSPRMEISQEPSVQGKAAALTVPPAVTHAPAAPRKPAAAEPTDDKEKLDEKLTVPAAESSGVLQTGGRFHVYGTYFGVLPAERFGFELGVSVRLIPQLEVGSVLLIGSELGGQLYIGIHPDRASWGKVAPYGQVRLSVTALQPKLTAGGGLLAGVTVEQFSGRFLLGFSGEAYDAPTGLYGLAALFVAGYELDL